MKRWEIHPSVPLFSLVGRWFLNPPAGDSGCSDSDLKSEYQPFGVGDLPNLCESKPSSG